MARRRKANKTGRSLGPADKFVALRAGLRETQAWRSLSFAARAVYIEIAAGVHRENNGKAARSSRFLADVVATTRPTVDRALRDLIERGFIVREQGGCLGPEGKGKPALWRITEVGTMSNPTPTKDYLKWQPPKFRIPATQIGHSGNANRPLRAKGGNANRPGWQRSYATSPASECPEWQRIYAKSSLPGERGDVPDLRTLTAGLGLCPTL